MSIRFMSAIWDLDLPDSEKLIALALADWSSDEGVSWPSVAQIAKKASKSERTVQGVLVSLEKRGYLHRDQRPGKGCVYTLTPAAAAPRKDCAPQPLRKTPAAAAPNTSGTTIKPKKARAMETLVPADFAPSPKPGSITAKAMDAWPPGHLESRVEHFIDHHTAKGTLSFDWQASWRTWVKNEKKWTPTHARARPANDGFGPSTRAAFGFLDDG